MTTVPLPFLLVESLPYDCLLLVSPTRSVITSASTGQVLHENTHETPLQAPRCSSVLPLSGSAEASSSSAGASSSAASSTTDCLVALVTDEKDLLVYRVTGLQQANVNVEQIYKLALPKRAIKIAWESDDIFSEDVRVVVGDRHGDVRSFPIPLSPEAEERESKRRKISQNGVVVREEEGEEIDKAHPPHLGHASMLTSFVLTSFTETSPEKPARFIITSDRDEHIRISRWGERRAGHLALRYLLGSKGAIGGLCVVEHGTLRSLQARLESAPVSPSRIDCRRPLLISTDSSHLRVWSLHRDSEVSASQPDCLLKVDLYEAVSPYIRVDTRLERLRERTFAKGVSMSKKKQTEAVVFDEHVGKVRDSSSTESDIVIMQNLSLMESEGEVYLIFFVDGATGLFTIALSKLLSSTADPSAYLQVLDLGLPILDRSSINTAAGSLMWLVCDVRHPVGEGYDESGLKLARWASAEGHWEEVKSGYGALDKQKEHLQSEGSAHLAYSLLLYDALCLYPKQEFEMVSDVHDAVAPNGLVRGGLSNFDKLGAFKNDGTTNSERATNSRAKLREEMLRRIEQSLGDGSSAS